MNDTTLMPLRDEAVVRLIHARGTSTLGELLTDYRARPMSADVARSTLARLAVRGWISRGARGGPGRHTHWSVARGALPYLSDPGRLPFKPGAAANLNAQHAARYARAPMALPRYTPPASAPVRDGAADFLHVPSLGPF